MTAPSLYQQVMGTDFEALAPELRRFHSMAGDHVLTGWVDVDAPASKAARCLAWCLGSPRTAQSGPIRFVLRARPSSEVWERHFPDRVMKSELRLAGSQIVERLGAAQLTFALTGTPEKLAMKLVRMKFLGIPCPSWLMPRVLAEETGAQGRLHFRVEAALPLIGKVASYRGHLGVGTEGIQ